MPSKLDQDLIEHACDRLLKVAKRHVRDGMAPASAAREAIRETKHLFPADWRLAVQGSDADDEVEVWEVEHKRPHPCAQIARRLEKLPRAKPTKRAAAPRRDLERTIAELQELMAQAGSTESSIAYYDHVQGETIAREARKLRDQAQRIIDTRIPAAYRATWTRENKRQP